MELRDIVEVLAGLDDERRAITNGVQRALDALERALLPPERFGVPPARVEALRERAQHALSEAQLLNEIGDQIRERLVEDVRLEGEKLALLSIDSHQLVAASLERLTDRIGGALDHARAAHEALGALRALLARRRDVESTAARLASQMDPDEVTDELLVLALQARHAGDGAKGLGARSFIVAAEESAGASGLLAGLASNARALRDALRMGRDPGPIAVDLRERVKEAASRLWNEREEARRQLAHVEREADRRRGISHGLFQAVTKATEILERIDRFERLPESQRLADGALGQLKAACLEHGLISVLLGLQEVTIDRADLDASLSRLSQELGALLGLLHDRPDDVERIVPSWDDIAAVDAKAQEAEWEAACRDALGVRRDGQGLLSVSHDTLALLVSADSLLPFRDRLFQQVETKMAEVLRATERLEGLDRMLSDACDEGGSLAEHAVACKAALTRFVGESLHLMGECHAQFRRRLHAVDTGFGQVEARVAPFRDYEDAAGAPIAERRQAMARTLANLRLMFADLETRLPGGGGRPGESKEADERMRSHAASLQERVAASLAGLRRLRELVLPPLPAIVTDAVALADALRRGSTRPADASRERLGEALESLLHERLYHEALELGPGGDCRPLTALGGERNRRLLDIVGASLTLAFRLLCLLAEELDSLPEEEREPQVEWMEELVEHVRREMDLHAILLDDVLLDLPDNASRLERHGVARDAVRGFLATLARTGAGAALAARHAAGYLDSLEAPLGRLGTGLLDGLPDGEADWRATSRVESLIDLHEMLLAKLDEEPTRTDVAARIRALRDRAIAVRDAILERAEIDGPGDGVPNRLFS